MIEDKKTVCKEEEKKDDIIKSKIVYNLDDIILQQINIDKNLVLRVIENANGKFIDIRRFYKEYPTKKGIRFTYGTFAKLKDLLE